MTDKREKSADRFQSILAEIAAEDPAARMERWQGTFDRLAGTRGESLVLFGAGHLGKWVLGRLRRAAVEPVCFSDSNSALWGTLVHGLKVLSPRDAVERFGQSSCFVVTVYNGSAVRERLRGMGCAVVLPAPVLFWKYPEASIPSLGVDTPERLVEDKEQIRQCCALLADEASRHELCDQVEWRYWMRPEFLPLAPDRGELYFPADLITENEQEVFVDGGAYDGDSIRSFLHREQGFRHLYALEPDTENLTALRASLQALPEELQAKVTVWPFALADKDDTVSFVETHDMGSRVSSTNEGAHMESKRLDSLPWGPRPTYIKLDIEGSEPSALAGGADLIREEMPVLAVCLYHHTEHLWQIPNLIHALAPGYSFYLRRYAEDCWEQVCYAVPPGRLR